MRGVALLVCCLLGGALAARLRQRQAPLTGSVHPSAANFFSGMWDPTNDKKSYSEMADQVKAEREAGHKIVGKIDKKKLGEINETRYGNEWHREYRPNNCDSYHSGPYVPGDIDKRPCYRNKTAGGNFYGAGSLSASPQAAFVSLIMAVIAAIRFC